MDDNGAESKRNDAVTEQPWHAAFPAPLSEARSITAAETLNLLKSGDTGGQRFVLIDLRRVDHEVSLSGG